MSNYSVCLFALLLLCLSACSDGSDSVNLSADSGSPDDTTGTGDADSDTDTDGDGDTDRDTNTESAPDADGGSPYDAGLPYTDLPPAEPCSDSLHAVNGQLNLYFGDLPPAEAFEGNPLDNGPYSQVKTTHSMKNPYPNRARIDITVYAPGEDNKTIIEGPFPLIMVLPGYGGQHPSYIHFTTHFVSHGFAVVGMNFGDGDLLTNLLGAHDLVDQDKNTVEVRATLDWALTQSPLAGKIDEDKIGIGGHSLGGKIAFFTASTDNRFKIVMGWDPQNAGGGPPCMIAPNGCNKFPIAPNCRSKESGILHHMRAETIIFAGRDNLSMPDSHLWAEHYYRGAPSPTHMVLFPNAGHNACAPPGDVSVITERTQMALLLARFKGMAGLEDYLPGGSALDGADPVGQHWSK